MSVYALHFSVVVSKLLSCHSPVLSVLNKNYLLAYLRFTYRQPAAEFEQAAWLRRCHNTTYCRRGQDLAGEQWEQKAQRTASLTNVPQIIRRPPTPSDGR